MTKKTLDTLPNDIYALFSPDNHHEVSEENLDKLCENLKNTLRNRLSRQEEREFSLRFSSMGKPDRKIWYDAHPEPGTREPMVPKTYLKFLYGDVLEELLLFLAKEAGHEVSDEQREVEVDGIKGHIDAIIDGVVVDVKSASPFGYKKFERQEVEQDDPFGYVAQLSGYANVLTPGEGAAWLAFDKVGADICVSNLSSTVVKYHKPETRIEELRKVIENDTPPERCYELVPDGKSGNLKLGTGCSYCDHKFRCYPGLRTFLYSTGPRFLAKVAKTPDVPEVEARLKEVE